MRKRLYLTQPSYSLRRFRGSALVGVLGILSAATLLSIAPSLATAPHASGPLVLELKLDGVVDPILATRV